MHAIIFTEIQMHICFLMSPQIKNKFVLMSSSYACKWFMGRKERMRIAAIG